MWKFDVDKRSSLFCCIVDDKSKKVLLSRRGVYAETYLRMRESIGISNVTRPFNAASFKLKFSIKKSEKKNKLQRSYEAAKTDECIVRKEKVLAKKKRIED